MKSIHIGIFTGDLSGISENVFYIITDLNRVKECNTESGKLSVIVHAFRNTGEDYVSQVVRAEKILGQLDNEEVDEIVFIKSGCELIANKMTTHHELRDQKSRMLQKA